MIEIEKSRKELINHVKSLNLEDSKAEKKLEHILRVSQNCKEIAKELKLTQEQISLAELIGLLHDIGRFEQYKITDIEELKKFDHGEAGVKLLKENNYIRKYIKDNKYDEIIYTAVYEHNKYELSKNLTKEKELFCKIIKDADKIDLLYEGAYVYWQQPERKKQVEEGKLSPKMLKDFYKNKLADNRNSISQTDQILTFTSFVFDLNFDFSLKTLKENGNVTKMIEKFDYQDLETKEEMKKVKKFVNIYLETNILRKDKVNWAKNY